MFLLRHRFGVCVGILLGTLLFGYSAFRLQIHTDFFDLYPPAHPYIKLYHEYRHLVGTANVLQIVSGSRTRHDLHSRDTDKRLMRSPAR